ncbi:hypothetical protein BHE74_00051638 [Ensete ventricosum]|nr:hypothetical protein GW17_00024096 [Ensete ventricosum]RWW42775.1 hypothetical protein BHE74_00051638 [Ensete ventricosum]
MVHLHITVKFHVDADRPLPGGTAYWGCFLPVSTRNRSITVHFDFCRLLSGGNDRFRLSAVNFGRYQSMEKEEKGEEEGEEKGEPGVRVALPILIHRLRAMSSPRVGRRNISSRGEKK